MVLFTEGSGKFSIDYQTRQIRPFQFYFMTPGQIHNWHFEGDMDGYIINFRAQFFQSFLLKTDYLNQFLFFNGNVQDCIIDIPEELRWTVVNISRDSKRNMKIVKVVCIWLIVGHWLDYWQMIMPGTTGPQSHWYSEIGIIEATVFIGFVGLFVYLMLNALSKLKSLAPKNHPFIEESLHHHIS
jgi:hypothetical protein